MAEQSSRVRTDVVPVAVEFATARFDIVRLIGEGGMGRVYEAYDRQRNSAVAFKTLTRLDPDGVYLLKNEFRSLADIVHTNIVRLYELFGDDGHWFFTMELVDGVHFDEWVRPRRIEPRTHATAFDEPRLRATLEQLCEAIAAIHAAGRLHRDLKPANVLVTPKGRVVVLDFGLAIERTRRSEVDAIGDDAIAGTPAYMAPEQAAGAPATRASDCYALGVMLFETITGRLPFSGFAHEMLVDKQLRPAPRLELARVPRDLVELCDALLARDANKRPGIEDVRRILSPSCAHTPKRRAPTRELESELLVGRGPELAQLRNAYDSMCAGRSMFACVSGESGAGKSALCSTFLDVLLSPAQVVILKGRCYEGENVSYKGIDSLVDDATRFLRTLPAAEVAAFLPKEVSALARVFPVLGRIDAIACRAHNSVIDPVELRERAFAAFAELLEAIRKRWPLICWIDDAQWLNRDALGLLEHLVSPSTNVPALLLLSHRTESAGSENVARLSDGVQRRKHWRLLNIPLARLSCSAARALATHLLDDDYQAFADEIATEANGNPFLLRTLARHVNRSSQVASAKLQDVLLAQITTLEPAARRLLECVALAGRPLPLNTVLRAVGARHDASDLLRTERLLRLDDGGRELMAECYHDKIREIVSQELNPDSAAVVHGQLLAVLELQPDTDPQLLALHARGAGDRRAAARYALLAAKRASKSLAFDQAALFYAEALRGETFDCDVARELRVLLADALTNAGRGEEAAAALIEAADASCRDRALELRARAGELLLSNGHVESGKKLLGEVLEALNLRLPGDTYQAWVLFLWERMRLRLRGLSFKTRDNALSDARKRELDLLWSIVHGLQGVDILDSARLSSRYARLALDSGCPEHGARALASEAYLMIAGNADRSLESDVETVLAEAESLATESASLETIAFVDVMRGVCAYAYGDQRRCRLLCEHAIKTLLENCTGAVYELSRARQFSLLSAGELGDFVSPHEVTELIDDAWRRGDMYAAIAFTGLTVLVRLFQGASEDLQRHIVKARKRWRAPQYFTWTDWFLLVAEFYQEIYRGQPRRGLDRLLTAWPAIDRAGFTYSPIRSALYFYRGATALAVARSAREDASELRSIAQRSANQLLSSRAPFGEAYGQTLMAWIEHERGDMNRAVVRFRNALSAFETSGMLVYATVTRAKLGALVGGAEGAALSTEARTLADAMRIKDLDSATRLLMLGLS